MVYDIRPAQWHSLQVWLAGGEGCGEDDRMDILEGPLSIVINGIEGERVSLLRGIEERKDHAQRYS